MKGRSTSCITPTPRTGCSASTSAPTVARRASSVESYADLLFVKGFDAGQPIVYLSTDAGQPLTAVLERSTYVPALNEAAYNGGDDFLGSARERLFGFINGQTGQNNDQAQGFQHLVLDGHAGEDASAENTGLINALRNGGDLLNVFGDFPTLARSSSRGRVQPAVGRAARAVDRKGHQRGPEQAPDRREPGVQPGGHQARPADRRQPGHRANPPRTARSAWTSTVRSSASPQMPPRPTSPNRSQTRSSRRVRRSHTRPREEREQLLPGRSILRAIARPGRGLTDSGRLRAGIVRQIDWTTQSILIQERMT